jgi:hypothetical protein
MPPAGMENPARIDKEYTVEEMIAYMKQLAGHRGDGELELIERQYENLLKRAILHVHKVKRQVQGIPQ